MQEQSEEMNPMNLGENEFTPDNRSWTERNGFAHWVMAFTWVIFAIIAFNVVGAVVGVIAAFFVVEDPTDINALLSAITDNSNVFFLVNTSGQFLIFALGTLLILKLSAPKGFRMELIRLKFRRDTLRYILIAIVLTISIYPTVLFLGWLNSFLPVPQWMAELQQTMDEMIKKLLKTENILVLGLIHIGMVPAICEEIMFRGYVQRSLEKSWGIWASIFVSGFVFGAYHLQITNILPLAALGILFAYITYISDSIIPAMFAHFANNGGQVVLSSFYPEMLDADVSPETQLPWLLIIFSIIVTAGLVYWLYQFRPKEEL